MILRVVSAIAISLWLAGSPCLADEEAREPVGLVLSGGGARGGAHVGVLKVLEELRVPVDFIAGTSSGALIGGLYASGLSPEEIEEAIRSIDWAAILVETRNRSRMSFRRKEDDGLALFPLEFGVSLDGFQTQSGIVVGENIEFALGLLTAHVSGTPSFDDLRIPFRAVATDLDSGKPVVIDEGDLTLAMRASMSVPGVFVPVERAGRVLIDGGIARNLPVDVAREMGAERVIAINVGTAPKEARGLSALGVLAQALAVLQELDIQAQADSIGPGGLLIRPDLDPLGAGQFERMIDAARVGEEAARAAEAELRRFSVSESEYEAFLKRQRFERGGSSAPVIEAIEVRGVEPSKARAIATRLRTTPGEPLDPVVLRADLDRVHRLGEFEKVGFRLEPVAEGKRLVVGARPKSAGPGFLRFGLGLESGFDGESEFRGLVHYRRPEINRLGAEWRALLSVGEPTGIEADFFQPLHARKRWFAASRFTWKRRQDKFLLPTGAAEFFDRAELSGELAIGVQISNAAQIRAGLRRGTLEADPQSETEFAALDADLGGWLLRADVDTLDRPFFPSRGLSADLDVSLSRSGLGASDVYDKAALRVTRFGGVGRNVLFGQLRLGTDFASELPIYDAFELGGFLSLAGLQRGELRGNVLGLATMGYYWRAFELGPVGEIYLGAAAQAGNVWERAGDAELGDLVYSGTLYVGADTPFVPVYLGFGMADVGVNSFYVFVGQTF